VASRAVTLAVVAPSLLARCRFAACPSLLAEPLRYAYPLLPAGYSVLLINSGDRYVLRLFTTVETVGLYSLAYKLSQAVSILLTVPLKNAIQPVAMKQEDQPEELKQFLARGATYTYAVALFLGLGLAVFSPEILRVLAPKRPAYWESAPIIPALAMAQALQCLQVFLGMGMVMAKASWLMSSILFACLALSLGLNFLLVPAIGLMGAALANATTYAVWSALKARYSQATYKMRFEARRLWLLSAAGPAMYGVSLLIVPSEISAASVIAKALVLTAFPVALCFSGFLLDSEKRAVSQWLGRA
jgi:O-antigen/teichoic acid export membrane protein